MLYILYFTHRVLILILVIVPEPDESTNCSNIEPVCNFKISSSFDASVDLDNNDLNYDDFDERSPDRLFGQDNSSSGAKDGVLDEVVIDCDIHHSFSE